MENEEISEKISALYALSDVMDNVCSYLNLKDLCRASQICKAWNEAVTREKARRSHIQRLLIPYRMDTVDATSAMYEKPYVTLLFFDKRLKDYMSTNGPTLYFTDEFLCPYRKLFPNDIICLEILEYFINEDNDVNLKTKDDENNILGLLFPMECRLDVKVCWGNYQEISDQLVEKLEMDEGQKQNSAFLIFAKLRANTEIIATMNDCIRKRFQNNRHTVWSAYTDGDIVVDCQSRRYDEPLLHKNFIALRISSSSFESWTLTMDCTDRREEFNSTLYEFRNKIRSKTFTFGLIYLPTKILANKEILFDGHETMKIISQIFSGIRIVSLLGSSTAIWCDPEKLRNNSTLKSQIGYVIRMSMIVIAYS